MSDYPLRKKIDRKMDMLEELMNTNHHLSDPEVVTELIDNLSFYWSVLSEEDRDFIHGCQFAVEEKSNWK
jgi:hypothetical protein